MLASSRGNDDRVRLGAFCPMPTPFPVFLRVGTADASFFRVWFGEDDALAHAALAHIAMIDFTIRPSPQTSLEFDFWEALSLQAPMSDHSQAHLNAYVSSLWSCFFLHPLTHTSQVVGGFLTLCESKKNTHKKAARQHRPGGERK